MRYTLAEVAQATGRSVSAVRTWPAKRRLAVEWRLRRVETTTGALLAMIAGGPSVIQQTGLTRIALIARIDPDLARREITSAYAEKGTVKRVAQAMGIHERTMYRLLRSLGLSLGHADLLSKIEPNEIPEQEPGFGSVECAT